MTRSSWISALALALALGGGTAWGQETNANRAGGLNPTREPCRTPMTPNCTRVPFFDELPRLLFPPSVTVNACKESGTLVEFCGACEPSKPCEVWSLCGEAGSDQATRGLLAQLLTLWETYFKEGRYSDAVRVAQKALGLVPGNHAAEIALALARKRCCEDGLPAGRHVVSQNAAVCPGERCSNSRINGGNQRHGPAGTTAQQAPVYRLPCCPPGTPWVFDRDLALGLTPVAEFAPDQALPGINRGPLAFFPPPALPFPCSPWGVSAGGPTMMGPPIMMQPVVPFPFNQGMESFGPPNATPKPPRTRVVRASVQSGPVQEAAGQEDIRVIATGKRVHIVSPCLEARCNRMMSLSPNGRVVLEGAVNLKCHVGDRPARVVAERVIVGLTDGSFEIEPAPALVPTAVFSEPVLRHVQPAWRAVPRVVQEKPNPMAVQAGPAACPSVPLCPDLDNPKP